MNKKFITLADINIIIYHKLIDVARAGEIISYNDIGKIRNLRGRSRELFQVLDYINRYEHQQGHPMLSAVVISTVKNLPGMGFFKLARNLGVYQESSNLLFWVNELHRVHDFWSPS